MLLLDTTLETPALNLALDEALLVDSERREYLRFWEPSGHFVVLGRSSPSQTEVNLEACSRERVPVLRRVSGGATILTGPGCLMYALVLDSDSRPDVASVDSAHRIVLGRLSSALRELDPTVAIAGTSDLVISREESLRKFSGNSVRITRRRVLYHGTLLYSFDTDSIARLLLSPSRQPEYRQSREHLSFVSNFPATRTQFTQLIAQSWNATEGRLADTVEAQATQLAKTKYSDDAWNLSR